mmetsp:Transcript_45107/g.70390  ORF Transcript_45107/g.70390 Transcript_45107/m.70390 type:complete len:267 (+) Transcript_45107:124-924(+)
MSSIFTSQYPDPGTTSTQNISEAICSDLMSPKVISDVSEFEFERNTENNDLRNFWPSASCAIKLNSLPCAMLGSASPNTPSNSKEANGCWLSSVDAMKAPWAQSPPMQILSVRQCPVIWPVPKVIVTSSGCSPDSTSEPSQLTCWTDEDCSSTKRSCFRQAKLSQLSFGTMRLPLPVSKTTVNDWGGVPILSLPKYAILCMAFVFFELPLVPSPTLTLFSKATESELPEPALANASVADLSCTTTEGTTKACKRHETCKSCISLAE